jgi:mannose-1-phosphate guanylyltransferase
MVFRTSTLLHWVRKLAPAMHSAFQDIYNTIGTEAEARTVREVYRKLKPVNFSKELLEPMVAQFPSSVVTLPVRNVLWSDWGTADRILDVLRRTGRLTRLNGRSKPRPRRVYRTLSHLSADQPKSLAPRAKEFAAEPASKESLSP